MTVKQLIEMLQSIPDDLKDCEIGVHQYQCIYTDVTSIDRLNVYVSDAHGLNNEVSFEEAKEADGYKFVVLM